MNLLYKLILILLLQTSFECTAQTFRFHQSDTAPKFIKPNTTNDTLLNPFVGGLNTPQFSNIDWNEDGVQDLFIFDKESHKVSTFIYENGKFKHAPKYEAAFPSYLTGWALLRDENFDGRPDLFTSSSFYNTVKDTWNIGEGYVQVFFNKRTNSNNFRFDLYSNDIYDTGMYVGYPYFMNFNPKRISCSKGSIPGIDDVDGDLDNDLIGNTSLEVSTLYLYENLKRNKWNTNFSNDTIVFIERDKCWGFVRYDFANFFTLGNGRPIGSGCEFNTWAKKSMKKHVDQNMTLIDLDGDGIKDLIFSDYEYKNLIALYNGRLQHSIQADSIVMQDTLFLSNNSTKREFISYPSVFYVDINGDNKQELVISTNMTPAAESIDNIWVFDATRINSKLEFTEEPGNDFLYQDMIDLGSRSVPAFVDIDGDGDLDLVVAASGKVSANQNNHDKLFLFTNIGTTSYPVFKLTDSNLGGISNNEQMYSAHPTFGDLDGDGKMDIIIGEGQGNIAYYKNTSVDSVNLSFELVNRNAYNILESGYAKPQLIDLDKDGLLDLVIGNMYGTVRYYRNIGSNSAPNFSSTPTIDSLGKIHTREVYNLPGVGEDLTEFGYSAPHIVDINNDGVFEMIAGSEQGRLYFFTNVYPHKDSIAKLIDQPIIDFGKDNNAAYNKRFGWYSTIASAHLNNDTFPDLIIGNISGGLNFLSTYYSHAADTVTPGVGLVAINDNSAICLYPNPSSGIVKLLLNKPTVDDINYEVFDITGKKIMEGLIDKHQLQPSINLSGFTPGLYVIKFNTPQWYAIQRIIKE